MNDETLNNYKVEYSEVYDDNYDEVYNEMAEVNIELGNREDFKKRVRLMMKVFLEIAMNYKNIVDFNHYSIIEKTHKCIQKEKARIVERLITTSIEERKVENTQKHYCYF